MLYKLSDNCLAKVVKYQIKNNWLLIMLQLKSVKPCFHREEMPKKCFKLPENQMFRIQIDDKKMSVANRSTFFLILIVS